MASVIGHGPLHSFNLVTHTLNKILYIRQRNNTTYGKFDPSAPPSPLLPVLPPSSWYDVDYSVASPLRFGQCLGCDFAEKSCFSYGWVGDV